MGERAKYTMRDVARLAGVSTSTVSAVVNGNVPVSPERKKRVVEAMAALDYHADAVARSLKTGKTNVIGVVVPDITNAFYPEVIRGIEDAARKAGYGVLLCNSNENADYEETHLSTVSSRRVDGVLIACCAHSRAYDTTVRRRFPIVFFDRMPVGQPDFTVSTDNVQAGYAAASHLIELGHRRIALLVGSLALSPHRDRLEGFRKAMQERDIPIRENYLIGDGVQIEDGRTAATQLLNSSPMPSAIVVSNNKLLLGVLQAMDENNVSVPEQMSLVTFDDYIWNKYFTPSITAIAQQTYEMGKLSFELLLNVINHSDDEHPSERHLRLPAELRIRRSTSMPDLGMPVAVR